MSVCLGDSVEPQRPVRGFPSPMSYAKIAEVSTRRSTPERDRHASFYYGGITMEKRRIVWFAMAGLLVLSGCGDTAPDGGAPGGASEMEEMPEAPMSSGSVSIMQPMAGAEVMGPNVEVVFQTQDLAIVEAGVMDPGTGHHHIFVDVDVTPMGEVIPAGVEGIIHKGDGTSVHLLEGLAPGSHRIIAVVADGMHVPLDPAVVDTVNFTVTGGGE